MIPYETRVGGFQVSCIADVPAAVATRFPGVPSASVLAPSPTTNTDVAASLIAQYLEIVKRPGVQAINHRQRCVGIRAANAILSSSHPFPLAPAGQTSNPLSQSLLSVQLTSMCCRSAA